MDQTSENAVESPSEPSMSEQTFIALGIAGIATYASYILYQSYRMTSPQILWSDSSNSIVPRVRCVNFLPENFQNLRDAFLCWLKSEEICLELCKVMFIEEEPEITKANADMVLNNLVRFAHESQGDEREGVICTVVYRSATFIDNEPLDIFMVDDAGYITRTKGKKYEELHCIGYTVDGKGVEVIKYSVKGFISDSFKGNGDGKRQLHSAVVPSKSTFSSIEAISSGIDNHLEGKGDTALDLTPLVGKGTVHKGRGVGILEVSQTLYLRLAAALSTATAKSGGYRELFKRSHRSTTLSRFFSRISRKLHGSSEESTPSAVGIPGGHCAFFVCGTPQNEVEGYKSVLSEWLIHRLTYFCGEISKETGSNDVFSTFVVEGQTLILLNWMQYGLSLSLLQGYWLTTDFFNYISVLGLRPIRFHFVFGTTTTEDVRRYEERFLNGRVLPQLPRDVSSVLEDALRCQTLRDVSSFNHGTFK